MNVIDEFLMYYAKEYDFYHGAAHQAAMVCESILQKNGIRANVSYRAKNVESLKEKLMRRNETKGYETIEDILGDLVDLSGVRIAVYFPSDKEEIGRLICQEFITMKRRTFPNSEGKKTEEAFVRKNYTGYDAVHYRVKMDEGRLEEDQKKYAAALVEIQVASFLMHAWSEVEHELVYKPKIGKLTDDEVGALYELNGLIMDGEVIMEKLQSTFRDRLNKLEHQFNNHFELAALIRQKLGEDVMRVNTMGRVDVLCRFLSHLGIDNPGGISKYLQVLETHLLYNSNLTIADCFAEMVLRDHADGWLDYAMARFEARMHNPYKWDDKPGRLAFFKNKTVRDFFRLWHSFDAVVRRTCRQNGLLTEYTASVGKILLKMLNNLGITLEDDLFSNLIAASSFRKRLLFTYKELPELAEAEMYLELLKDTIRKVQILFPAEYQNIFDEEISIQLL